LIDAQIPLALFGQGWTAPPASPERAAEPDSTVYLGRRIQRPGSAGSYAQVIQRTLSAYGPIGGTRQLMARARQRRASRAVTALLPAVAQGFVPAGKIAEVFSSYDVCLNFSNVWTDGQPGATLIPHVRLRDFEAPMCRACYLTGHTEEIREFYEVGAEIDTYRTVEELIDKTRFYLSHPDAAERLRQAGFLRASRDHTWTRRFTELFAKVGLPN
jgi:hypothetical protein